MPNSGIQTPISNHQLLKTLLAFETPKSSTLITDISILNAKKQGILKAKKMRLNCLYFGQNRCLKGQKWCLSFMKWTPRCQITFANLGESKNLQF